ncbi:Zinc finger protein 25 [Dirofilaria immitis]|nr:Zinc finger protein 25 [Dirofilaria immitis]
MKGFLQNEKSMRLDELHGRIFTSPIAICCGNRLLIYMLLPYYFLIASLPLCITQNDYRVSFFKGSTAYAITENDSSIQTGITDQLDLNQYNRTNTNKKLFECETCGKGFSQRYHLNEHNRIHTGERPFKCHKGNLKRHNRKHTGERPFECKVCGKRFIQRSDLNNHNKTHTGERPFKCHVCDKRFHRHCDLKNHNRTHTGERPFECNVCGKNSVSVPT